MSAERKAHAGAASDGSVVGSHAVTYRLFARPMRTTACRCRCVGQCLSRMRRKVPVRFLGEGVAVTPPPYPTPKNRKPADCPRFLMGRSLNMSDAAFLDEVGEEKVSGTCYGD